MSSEANEWLELHEQTDGALQGLSSDIRETQKTSASGGSAPKEKRIIARRLGQAKTDIDKLERSLIKMEAQPIAYKIGEGELSRRRQMLSSIRNLYQMTDDLNSGKTSQRLEMIRKKDLLSGGRGGYGAQQHDETAETEGVSNRDLSNQQQQMIDKQDQQLGHVLDGLTTLHHMGHDISTELDLHKHLLSDLDNSIDQTDDRIRINTQRVETVNEKAGGCCGMITMLVLLAIIIFLLASNAACHIFAPSRCD